MKVLLVGNPNVGKSALFSRLTGVDVAISNYAGTTVEYKKGTMRLGKEKAEVIDVPGTYSLSATSKAEEVAIDMLKEGDVVTVPINKWHRTVNTGRRKLIYLTIFEKSRHQHLKK